MRGRRERQGRLVLMRLQEFGFALWVVEEHALHIRSGCTARDRLSVGGCRPFFVNVYYYRDIVL